MLCKPHQLLCCAVLSPAAAVLPPAYLEPLCVLFSAAGLEHKVETTLSQWALQATTTDHAKQHTHLSWLVVTPLLCVDQGRNAGAAVLMSGTAGASPGACDHGRRVLVPGLRPGAAMKPSTLQPVVRP